MHFRHTLRTLFPAVAILACAAAPAPGGVTLELQRRPGPGITVAVRLRDISPTPASGYQVFLEFDTTRMTFNSGSYVTTNFGLPVVSPISATSGQITLAAGIAPFLGNVPTTLDQDVAVLSFTPIGTGCEPRVRVRASTNPPTRVTDDSAMPILPLTIINAWNTCPADVNNSGSVSVQDIFDFLSLWFSGDCRADFNNASGVTVQDLFDFLQAWFLGCP